MRPSLLLVLTLPLIAGCAMTPLQQCAAPNRAGLANVERDIRDTELALRRGFRLSPATSDTGLHYCETGGGMVTPCLADSGEQMYDKSPINRPAEAEKLEALNAERARYRAAIARCEATNPS